MTKYNKGHYFIFVAIDIFSKFVWMWPLENKKGESVARALDDILRDGRVPNKIG